MRCRARRRLYRSHDWSRNRIKLDPRYQHVAATEYPTVFTLCNMHLKLMHFGSSFACILGKFLVYIELNFNVKWRVSSVDLSVDFIYKMQWFLIHITCIFHAYQVQISYIQLRLQRLNIWLNSTNLYILTGLPTLKKGQLKIQDIQILVILSIVLH